jgi:hypothetical protein
MLLYKIIYTATDIAYIFLREIVANHGVSEEIVSDRDKLFTLKFWIILISTIRNKIQDVNVILSTNRRADRKIELDNGIILIMLYQL